MTEGQEIELLSQAPVAGDGGLHVPLDLLQSLYGNLLGYDFDWQSSERTLEVKRRPLRELPVVMDVVHLQGVTTLVFEFPERPRYHLRKGPRAIDIELIGDRLQPLSQRLSSAGDFVRDVKISSNSIRIELASQTAVGIAHVTVGGVLCDPQDGIVGLRRHRTPRYGAPGRLRTAHDR